MTAKAHVKVALFRPDGKLLLLKRSKTDDRRPGEWDLPGGGVEPGEGLNAAASRELMEETGIEIAAEDLTLIFAATESWHEDSNTRLIFLTKTADATVTLSHEHDEYKWVDLETALREFPHPIYNAGLKYARDQGLL